MPRQKRELASTESRDGKQGCCGNLLPGNGKHLLRRGDSVSCDLRHPTLSREFRNRGITSIDRSAAAEITIQVEASLYASQTRSIFTAAWAALASSRWVLL